MVEPAAHTGAKTMQGDYVGLGELLAVIDDPAFGNEFVGNLLRSKLPELRSAIEALTRPAPGMVEKVALAIRDTDDPGPELAHVYARAAIAAIGVDGVDAPPERLPTEE